MIQSKLTSVFYKLFHKKSTEEVNFVPSPKHYYIVSFPKSGNTWVRFLLANVLCHESDIITFQRVGEFIPDSHRVKDLRFIHDANSLFNSFPLQLVKNHTFYSASFQNVIYVVRDGRDALTSYYHWMNARTNEHVPLSDIICGEAGIGLWSKHVLGWAAGDCCKKLIIWYEDLLDDAEKELRRILAFVGLDVEPQRIFRAVELSSFDNIQGIEKEYGIFDGHVEAIKKVPFLRKGVGGDWENLFTQSDIDLFWKYHRKAMVEMGYVQ